MIRKLIAIVANCVILCVGLVTVVQAIPFNQISQMYFFGDSLTDSGFNNLFPVPAGKEPTYTTYGGYIWSQYLARDLKGFTLIPPGAYVSPGIAPPDTITNNTTPLSEPTIFVSPILTGINYAAAGSTTNSRGFNETWAPSLHAQVQHFITTQGGRLDPSALYFIWSGANDFLTLLFAGPVPTELQFLTTAQIAAMNIANEVETLAQHGAKRIVVMSLPNIGITPLINIISTSSNLPALPALMKTVSYTFNSLLNQQLGQVIARTGIKVLYVDTYKLLNDVVLATQSGQPYIVAGQVFQFTNYTQPVCGNPLTTPAIICPPGTPTGFVFADGLHPTDMAHRVISLQVETLIAQWQ